MPTLHHHQPGLRVLLCGDPGSGKTTAIGKLAEHGQHLYIADLDHNLNPLTTFLSPTAFERIHYETLIDPVTFNADARPVVNGIPPAFSNFCRLSERWVDSETGEDFGKPEEWGRDSWFVIDSLTGLAAACMHYTMFKRRRMGKRRSYAEWGDAIERLEGALQLFAGHSTNLICTAHLARLSLEDVSATADEDGQAIERPTQLKRLPPNATMRYPVTLGQRLPPRVGGYFNLVLQAQRIGSGVGATRVLKTTPEEDVDIKIPLPPGRVPPEVRIDKLWDILKLLQGGNNAKS